VFIYNQLLLCCLYRVVYSSLILRKWRGMTNGFFSSSMSCTGTSFGKCLQTMVPPPYHTVKMSKNSPKKNILQYKIIVKKCKCVHNSIVRDYSRSLSIAFLSRLQHVSVRTHHSHERRRALFAANRVSCAL
jgi:hypothetical protein